MRSPTFLFYFTTSQQIYAMYKSQYWFPYSKIVISSISLFSCPCLLFLVQHYQGFHLFLFLTFIFAIFCSSLLNPFPLPPPPRKSVPCWDLVRFVCFWISHRNEKSCTYSTLNLSEAGRDFLCYIQEFCLAFPCPKDWDKINICCIVSGIKINNNEMDGVCTTITIYLLGYPRTSPPPPLPKPTFQELPPTPSPPKYNVSLVFLVFLQSAFI